MTVAEKVRVVSIALMIFSMTLPISQSANAAPPTVAFLGVHLQNDNAGLEPITDAERARMVSLENGFKDQLEKSGDYKFVPVSDALKTKISQGQEVGLCGGCEVTYGKDAAADQVAWITVQKVSNLILNLNVFIENVADSKVVYEHSVDIRGNTDESWSRSLSYVIKNYPPVSVPKS